MEIYFTDIETQLAVDGEQLCCNEDTPFTNNQIRRLSMSDEYQAINDDDQTIGFLLSRCDDFSLSDDMGNATEADEIEEKVAKRLDISTETLALTHAYVKHAKLASRDEGGHRIRDHYRWALDSTVSRVLHFIETNLDTVEARTRADLVDLNNLSSVMAYMKEARLIVEADDIDAGHGTRSHVSWANGQTVVTVKRSIKTNVVRVRDALGIVE